MTKTRLLFVDDEPRVLDGLRRALRSVRDEWEMDFVDSGAAALQALELTPYDLVVSDVRMPAMGGIELLEKVRTEHPGPIRVILSGFADELDTLRSTTVAHQYLAKPCHADVIRETVHRATGLRAQLSDPKLLAAISDTSNLPAAPSLYQRLMNEVTSGDPSLARITEIVRQDIALTAKILQIVNSAFFGLRRHVDDIGQAVNYLGIDTIMALTLTTHLFSQPGLSISQRATVERVWQRSLGVATMAKAVAATDGSGDAAVRAAFLAGMLHDAGQLIFAMNWPETTVEEEATLEWEREAFGADHALVGAYLLSTWGLPDDIVEAVAHHHEPSRAAVTQSPVLTAVHVACALEAREHHDGLPVFDQTYLDRAGISDRIESWVAVAEDVEYEREHA